jgi:hypothetical protein
VGDISTVSLLEPKLTEDQRKKRDELRRKRDALQQDMMVFWEQWNVAVKKEMGIPEDEEIPENRMDEYSTVLNEVMMADKEYLKLSEESSEAAKELAPLEGGHGYVGFVRLCLLK